MRKWSAIISPPDMDARQVEIHEKLNLYLNDVSDALGNISRGVTIDSSQKPLPVVDDGRFFLLKGRPFGQYARGAVEAGGDLTLSSTNHATKGSIFLGQAAASLYDEVNDRLGVNQVAPAAVLHVTDDLPATTYTTFIGDITTPGTWTTDSGAGLPWYSHIDETPATLNVSDFLLTANPVNVSSYEGQLATVPAVGTLTIAIHAKCASGAQFITFRLIESVTTRASRTFGLTTTPTTYTFTLTGGEYAAISNFSNLRLSFGYDGSGSGSISQVTFYAGWVESPSTGTSTGITAILEQPTTSMTALQLLDGSANQVNFKTPSSVTTPWTITPSPVKKLNFADFTEVRVSGNSTALVVGSSASLSFLSANPDSGAATGQLTVSGLVTVSSVAAVQSALEVDTLSVGGNVPLKIRGHASAQTADLTRWIIGNVTNILSVVDATARFGIRTGTATLGASLQVYPVAAANVGVIIRGLTSQSGNLLEIQSVTPTTLLHVTSAGKLVTDNIAPQFNVPTGAVTVGHVWTATDVSGNGNWAAGAAAEVEVIGYYGDGSDGSPTLDGATDYVATTGINLIAGAYFMTRDIYCSSLTINNTITLETGGWRIFVKNTLTNNGIIYRAPGIAGGNGVNANGAGTGGTAGGGVTDDGSTAMGGAPNGRIGRAGTTGVGTTGFAGLTATGEGGSGGAGGAGEDNGFGGAGGASQGTAATTLKKWRNVGILLQWSFLSLVSGGTGGSSGASGAGDGVGKAAGGGGSGGGGGVIGIWSRVFVNSATGIVRANGSAGGNGGNFNANMGSGGGGGGGGGGFIYIMNDSFTNSGTIQCAGGAGGLHGTNGTLGGNISTDGSAGGTGTIVKYNRPTGVFS